MIGFSAISWSGLLVGAGILPGRWNSRRMDFLVTWPASWEQGTYKTNSAPTILRPRLVSYSHAILCQKDDKRSDSLLQVALTVLEHCGNCTILDYAAQYS